MRILSKQKTVQIFLFVILAAPGFAQKLAIDYYGIVSTEIDSNMSKMTSDLYYTQLCEINTLTVSDKRTEAVLQAEPESFPSEKLAFFATISKKSGSEKWIATLKLVDSSTDETQSTTKEYDSFYKILMEPKAILQDSIKKLVQKGASTGAVELKAGAGPATAAAGASTEFLAGTWEGESSIDKVVIMRGGRGFVVFKNGATMNITLEITGSGASQKITVTQKGHSNASFYPELAREVALKAAVDAEPIRWEFKITDPDSLSGTKYTLTEEDGSAKKDALPVRWKRKG